MNAPPLAMYTDAELRKRIKQVEALLKKHPIAGKAIIAQAPKKLTRRLPFLVAKLQRLMDLETERQKYKGNRLPVGPREFI